MILVLATNTQTETFLIDLLFGLKFKTLFEIGSNRGQNDDQLLVTSGPELLSSSTSSSSL